MKKRSPAQSVSAKAYATRDLRKCNHLRQRQALGRKLNLPTDKQALRALAESLITKSAT